MDTKHTPGPWKFSEGYITANGKPLSMVGVSTPMVVGPTRLEAIHNSRLAAAALDLLDVLRAIKTFGELANVSAESGLVHYSGGKKPATKDVWQFPRHLLVDIDAAIAKATETSHEQ